MTYYLLRIDGFTTQAYIRDIRVADSLFFELVAKGYKPRLDKIEVS